MQVVKMECESCLAAGSETVSREASIETSSIEYEDWDDEN